MGTIVIVRGNETTLLGIFLLTMCIGFGVGNSCFLIILVTCFGFYLQIALDKNDLDKSFVQLTIEFTSKQASTSSLVTCVTCPAKIQFLL